MLEERHRRLLAPLDSPGATGRFVIAPELPPEGLIANAYIVPRVRSEWLYLIQSDGRLQLPGGKKEPGESHREALDRELLEEAGAEIFDTSLIGHWLLRRSERGHSGPIFRTQSPPPWSFLAPCVWHMVSGGPPTSGCRTFE